MMKRVIELATDLFAVWVVVATGWAWLAPEHFRWFLETPWTWVGLPERKGFVAPGLGIIMLGMGITLRFADFAAVVRMPKPVALGVAAQYVIMPALGFAVARVFALESALAVGVILVSCCPGGTASNVITYLARANLPLSVLLTMCSTLLAVGATPFLTGRLAGSYVDVDEAGLLLTTLQVVLLPVVVGLLLNQFAPALVRWLRPVFPLVSVVVIALIVGAIVGVQRETIASSATRLLAAVFVLHAGGFGLGYLAGRWLGYDVATCRTLSVEVGMQNSGLGAALARKHFAAEPLTAVPAAISAVYHCVIGSLLAALWRRRTPPAAAPTPNAGGIDQRPPG